jgi:hypothetical protein
MSTVVSSSAKIHTPAYQAGSPPPRLEGEGQGGGVDKERGAKPFLTEFKSPFLFRV